MNLLDFPAWIDVGFGLGRERGRWATK